MLLPDDGIGVAVLTNASSGAVAPVAAYRVLDELLGLEPIDWYARYRPRYDAALTGRSEARHARRVVPDAPRPRPLEAYAGEYYPEDGRWWRLWPARHVPVLIMIFVLVVGIIYTSAQIAAMASLLAAITAVMVPRPQWALDGS